ncbi:MAG: type II toxin-antitoxin system VapC family toxin [Verrucomicrobiales bacterium]|nr:type II toxin-antitoxin system VapC family toxin [Verrucomicrobiales bacterium]
MLVIVLDTDVLSLVQRGDGPAYDQLVLRLDAADDDVSVCIVSFEEQMRGWLTYIARSKSLNQQIEGYAKLHALLDDFTTRPILDFDQHAAAEFQRLLRFKVRIGTMDLRIAAITIAQDDLLLSKNLTDFRKVPGLRVEDWTV